MILHDLGYCCLQRFFTLYPSTILIAARLGVTTRAIRYLKREVKKGRKGQCTNCPSCLHPSRLLTERGVPPESP